jgi:hypothetical protein
MLAAALVPIGTRKLQSVTIILWPVYLSLGSVVSFLMTVALLYEIQLVLISDTVSWHNPESGLTRARYVTCWAFYSIEVVW